MNSFLEHTINELTTQLTGIQAIALRGSRLIEDQIDFWSDFDLIVVLQPSARINEDGFIDAVKKIGKVIGSELHKKSNSILYRVALEHNKMIHLLDASVCSFDEWLAEESSNNISKIVYGHIQLGDVKETEQHFSFDSYACKVNETWFKYFITIKKFARDDNLIGLHILLDLVREYLVVEMIERDIALKTNIHKFGRQEKLPGSIKFSMIDETNKEKVFDYILKLAQEYDKQLLSKLEGYNSRLLGFSEYVKETKRHLQYNE